MGQYAWAMASSVCMGILILDSRTAFLAVTEALELCVQSLIPSLFPFLFVSSLMTNAWMGTSPGFLEPMRKLLGIPEGCSCILIPAFLGGYPAGAQAVGQTLRSGGLDREDAGRLLLVCNNPGPSFLFGVLGPVFPELWMVWALWGICVSGTLLLAWMLPRKTVRRGTVPMGKVSASGAMTSAMKSMAGICCWVIVFRVLIRFLQRWFFRLLPETMQVVLTGLLELANGCLALSGIGSMELRFVTAAGLLSFGGLCVTMQTGTVAGDLPLLPYCLSKLIQAALSITLAACVAAGSVFGIPAVLFVCYVLKKTVAFRWDLMYNEPRMSRRNHYAVSKKNGAGLRLLRPRNPAG